MSDKKEDKTSFFSMMGKETIEGIRQDFVLKSNDEVSDEMVQPSAVQQTTEFVPVDNVYGIIISVFSFFFFSFKNYFQGSQQNTNIGILFYIVPLESQEQIM